ncbi:MAG: hypothetical protein ACFFB5_22680 [Promethearchaeota archaeon]
MFVLLVLIAVKTVNRIRLNNQPGKGLSSGFEVVVAEDLDVD